MRPFIHLSGESGEPATPGALGRVCERVTERVTEPAERVEMVPPMPALPSPPGRSDRGTCGHPRPAPAAPPPARTPTCTSRRATGSCRPRAGTSHSGCAPWSSCAACSAWTWDTCAPCVSSSGESGPPASVCGVSQERCRGPLMPASHHRRRHQQGDPAAVPQEAARGSLPNAFSPLPHPSQGGGGQLSPGTLG